VTDRRKYLILIGVICAVLVGAVMLAVPGSPIYQKPTLGLDLQGGLEVVLQAQAPKGKTLQPSDLDRSVSIMQSRINKLGVSEPEIRKQGSNQIVIQLAGVHDPAKAAAIIGKTAQLMLFDFENDLVSPSIDSQGNPVPAPSLYSLLKSIQPEAAKGSPEAYYLFKTKTKTTTAKPTKKGAKPKATETVTHSIVDHQDTRKVLLRPYGGNVPNGMEVLKVPAHRIVVSCAAATGCLGANAPAPGGVYYYLLKFYPTGQPNGGPAIPEMTGSDLVLSGVNADFGQAGQPIVTLQFTNHGGNQFGKITKDEAQRGQTKWELAGKPAISATNNPYAQHFAIVLDQQLESSPLIDFQQFPDGIQGNNAEIDLNGSTIGDAKNLALVLQTGALPVTFKQIERTDVSATLGKSSLTQAWHAALVGLIVVALFLLVLYRFLGLVAVFGLAI
jgi:protein-export membrane protein SecD